MKRTVCKLAASLVIFLLMGAFLFALVRWGDSASPVADFLLPLGAILCMFLVLALVYLFFPKDIQRYPPGKKFLIGLAASALIIVLTFAAFLALAFLLVGLGLW